MNRWRFTLYPLVFAILLGALAGCGRKGPLYLPDRPPPQRSVAGSSGLR
ncbi:MAG: LPS translocon maturation chaperone LptM [Acidiferrobacterales bacterium]